MAQPVPVHPGAGVERLSRAALPKLVSMPPAAIEFVRTGAILGDSAERRHPAALARIDSEAASEAEAALRRAGMFEACGAQRRVQGAKKLLPIRAVNHAHVDGLVVDS